MTALRELAERWKRRASLSDGKGDLAFANTKCAAELLSILDADGDGGAAGDDDLPGMWSNADFTGGDPDERCHAERSHEDEMFNTFRLAYYGSNKSLAPSLESFRRAYKAINPQPVRSGVVSEWKDPTGFSVEGIRDEANNWTRRETGKEMLLNYAAALEHFAKSQGESNV